MKTLKTFIIFSFSLISLFLSGCGSSHNNSNADRYVYQNPDKGAEVELKEATPTHRLSDQIQPEIKPNEKSVRVFGGHVQVNISKRLVSFRFTKETRALENVQTEEILLSGHLDATMKGWIDDTRSSELSGSRAYAYVSCFPDSAGNVCANMYVSVRYADENGEEKEMQFHASPRHEKVKARNEKRENEKKDAEVASREEKKEIEIREPSPAKKDQKTDIKVLEPIKPEPAQPAAPASRSQENKESDSEPEEADSNDLDLDEGTTHEADDDDTTSYVTPQSPEDWRGKLIGIKKSAPSIPSAQGGTAGRPAPAGPATPAGPLAPDAPPLRNLVPLNLIGNGISLGSTNAGRLKNATALPTSGSGFIRQSRAQRAYGSGLLIDFLKSSSDRFTASNPTCGKLVINEIAVQNGGRYGNHRSHQNGSDVDISYFAKRPWQTVISRGTTISDFKHDCFLKYLKFVSEQKFEGTGDPRYEGSDIVDLVFVNAAVRKGVCDYAKKNNLTETYKKVLPLLYPEEGHHKHFHMRVRCSPKHIDCKNIDLDRRFPFKKRGCH